MQRTSSKTASTDWLRKSFGRTVSLPVWAFLGAVLTDWSYSGSANMMWANWSSWLILFGLIGCGAAFCMLALAVRDERGARGGRIALAMLAASFMLQVVNFMIHMRDGWTAVVPMGLTLSIIGAALTLVSAWLARQVKA